MQISMGVIVIQLAEKKILAFRGARDIDLQCTEGMVWLTVEGQSCDFILAKGEQLHMESNGLALVQGVPSGSVQMVNMASNSIRQKSRRLLKTIDLNLSGRRDIAVTLLAETFNGEFH